MTYWIFLISTIAVVQCRPQVNIQEPAVEVEQQHVIEIHPDSRQLFEEIKTTDVDEKQLEQSTKEILEKIALVNEKQGLNKKKPKPYHFPFSYHLRSQEHFNNREPTNFKFSRDPFSNPILDYVEQESNSDSNKKNVVPMMYKNKQNEEVPPGHYIKRKITHQQTIMLPAYNYMAPNMMSPNMESFYNRISAPLKPEMTVNKSDLERQTIDNIRNIIGYSQYPSSFAQPSNQQNPYFYQPWYATPQQSRPAKQQWQWPFGQYFPIIVKDPFQHMMNAVTTMVEYGPQASPGTSCKKQNKKADNQSATSPKAKQISEAKLTYNVVDNGEGAEITVLNDDDSNLTTVVDIEDLQITDNKKEPLQLKLNFREAKQNEGLKTNTEISKDVPRQSPPRRDQVLFDDELADDEDEKAEDIQISHQGTKKLVSKDNTGSGIFVHKIKVRKGGVAIAGPGGIATAGSGGTAIVGPNGFAYTHPDSLAIAGSGTKVVAVEPTINLSQVVMDHNKNKTRGDGHTVSRLGKIVAVGPVIYYNKG